MYLLRNDITLKNLLWRIKDIMKKNNPLVSIIIPTYNRSDVLKKCLLHLNELTYKNFEVIISDASDNDASEKVTSHICPQAIYFKVSPDRKGCITQRNDVFDKSKGSIIAYIDDDSLVFPDWLNKIVDTYTLSDDVGGVGGRALRGDILYWDGKTPIGRINPDGYLTEGFDGNCGEVIEVDNLIACNMSYKRNALEKIGGWDEWYDCERAETDLAICVKKAGYRILYNPKALVDHIGSPRIDTKRFSLLYDYRTQRNHVYMLIKNYGVFSKISIFYLTKSTIMETYKCAGRIVKSVLRLILNQTAKIIGLVRGILK